MLSNQFSLNVMSMDDTYFEKITEIVKNAMHEYHIEHLNGAESVQKIKNKVSLKKAAELSNVGYSTVLYWNKKGWLRTYGSRKGSFVFLNEFRDDFMTIQKKMAEKKK